MKLKLLTAGLAVLAVLACFGLVRRELSSEPSDSLSSPIAPSPETNAPMGATTTGRGAEPGQASPAQTTEQVDQRAWEIEGRAQQLSIAVMPLMDAARKGDFAAIASLDRLLARCEAFSPDYSGATLAADASLPMDVQRQQNGAIAQSRRFCDWEAPGIPAAQLKSAVTTARRDLLQAGNLAALASQLDLPAYSRDPTVDLAQLDTAATSEAVWNEAIQSRDPDVMMAALEFLLTDGVAGGARVQPLNDMDLDWSSNPRVRGIDASRRALIRDSAIQWLACDLGMPCGPNTAPLYLNCIVAGDCAMHLDYREFIRQRMLTPTEYEALTLYLELLRRTVGR